MSDVEIIERDDTTGRFLPGNSGNGGRKPGSRNKLGEQFLADLRDCWLEHGPDALARCAKTEPGRFCQIIAGLLPRDVNLNVSLDAATFADRFRTAFELLGNPEPPMMVIKPRVSGRRVAGDRGS